MRKGFIFSQNKCVDCGACIASCILENGWKFQPRTIYRINPEALPYAAILNLSMACNHCDKPACLTGCPAAAYSRDISTNAVIINEEKCLGCDYCKWNCPYDAPKSDPVSGLIGKCNLCLPAVKEGLMPACASACPTGALCYDTISEVSGNNWPEWSRQKKLNPAVEIRAVSNDSQFKIIPEEIFSSGCSTTRQNEKDISGAWSLIAFSFLATLSVSLFISAFIGGKLPEIKLILPLIILSGIFSLFHLKRKLRAWRSILNITRSPLSREIAFYLVYLFISAGALVSETPGMILAASLTGLVLLAFIDLVYTFPDNRAKIIFHSGQAFLTGLLMVSFFSGLVYPFLFIAAIKIIPAIYNVYNTRERLAQPVLRFIRLALLLISGGSLFSGFSYPGAVISIIFMTGELIDRILFYLDFEPVNIKSVTQIQLTHKPDNNEKKRN
jgi:Fe-S-cluster-containing dehydrogenase component/DMSO reductase anchor subunit